MKLLIALIACAAPLLAAAQAPAPHTVWRCGADGRSYSDTPCAEGRALGSDSARPASDVQAARVAALREQQLATQLERDRLSRERQTRGNGLSGIPLSQPTAAAASQPRHRLSALRSRGYRPAQSLAADGTWQAIAPASRRKPG